MENGKKTITANEINKFTYCPYQWYYERYYGQKALRQMVKERNERLGYEDTTQSKLTAGTKYHQKTYVVYKIKIIVARVVILLLLVIVLYGLLRFGF